MAASSSICWLACWLELSVVYGCIERYFGAMAAFARVSKGPLYTHTMIVSLDVHQTLSLEVRMHAHTSDPTSYTLASFLPVPLCSCV